MKIDDWVVFKTGGQIPHLSFPFQVVRLSTTAVVLRRHLDGREIKITLPKTQDFWIYPSKQAAAEAWVEANELAGRAKADIRAVSEKLSLDIEALKPEASQ